MTRSSIHLCKCALHNKELKFMLIFCFFSFYTSKSVSFSYFFFSSFFQVSASLSSQSLCNEKGKSQQGTPKRQTVNKITNNSLIIYIYIYKRLPKDKKIRRVLVEQVISIKSCQSLRLLQKKKFKNVPPHR